MGKCENCGNEGIDFELIDYDKTDSDKLLCSICVISEALRKLMIRR